MFGAREASDSTLLAPLRRLIGRAMARDLRVLVVPGPDVALAHGLDLAAVGLRLAANPREANVLLLIGPLGTQLRDAASVAYAQMPRPRAILALGVSEVAPLPNADASAGLSQDGLRAAISDLRGLIATGSFARMTEEFQAPALQSRIEYTCPMHPEVVSDQPGACPKCGMFLVPRETDAGSAHDHAAMAGSEIPVASEPHHHAHGQPAPAYTCPMHPEVTSDEPGSCPKCGMTLVSATPNEEDTGDHAHGHTAPAAYTCPMHPEVTSDEPGSCPKCGMTLVSATPNEGDTGHHAHGHTAPAAYTCPMHPEVTSDEPGSCPKCGMTLVSATPDEEDTEHHAHGHTAPATYTCPMHPEVTSAEPGSCPKCGMTLVSATPNEEDTGDHAHVHTAPATYTCPMHPEVTSDEPGSCPKCGMTLVSATPNEGDTGHHAHGHTAPAAYTCPMHPEVTSDEPGSCPKCGMTLVSATPNEEDTGDHAHGHTAPAVYTCPMHPEVTSAEPGSCPKCGMTLVPATPDEEDAGHHAHGHPAPAAYTCPMHPEVTSDEPGSCPKCGMTLVPATSGEGDTGHHAHGHPAPAAYTCPMHPEVVSDEPGSCPKCGMTLVPATPDEEDAGHHAHGHTVPAAYTCPMHPEVTSAEPGSCPKCGMTLVPIEPDGDGGHDQAAHGGHMQYGSDDLPEGIEPGFMSMVEMTEGTPRSSDGLQMEWIKAPFGPFFPGLPGGLTLMFTLDGDTVAMAETGTLVGLADPLRHGPLAPEDYVGQIGVRLPLVPVSYQLLACRAIEAASGTAPGAEIERGRDAALARERIASHLIWLAQLGRQLGLPRIQRAAEALALTLRHADRSGILRQVPDLHRLIERTRATPFLTRRLAQVGRLSPDADWVGPTTADPTADPTAAGRLAARLDEIAESLGDIEATTVIVLPALAPIGDASGHGHASVRTPRGIATLHVTLEAGKVAQAMLDTPSSHHIGLVGPLTEQRELADALVAVASLDLDPWEIGA
jgi:hypothetical protein